VEGYYPYFALVFMMDEAVTTSERTVKTLLVALSNTGGIMGFFIVIIGSTIQYFQTFYFN